MILIHTYLQVQQVDISINDRLKLYYNSADNRFEQKLTDFLNFFCVIINITLLMKNTLNKLSTCLYKKQKSNEFFLNEKNFN